MMSHDEHDEEREEGMHHHMGGMGGPMKKEFKLAMLEKKEKILQAKLEFIGKIKAIIQKMPDEKK